MAAPTPPITANLAARYRASELGLASGARVTSWADLSGAGRTITSATGPVYRPTGLNGQPACEFAAVAGEKLAAGTSWMPKPFAAYAAVKTDSVAATFWWGSFTGYTTEELMGLGSSSRWVAQFDNFARGTIAGDVTATVHGISADGTNILNYWRNESGLVRPGFYNAATFAGAGPGLFRMGGKSAAGNEWDGMIAEVLIYSAFHGPADASLMMGWLADQYGIGPSLPREYGVIASSGSSGPTTGRLWPR